MLLCKGETEVLEGFKGAYIECENPNEFIYKFEGTMIHNQHMIPLGID